MAFFGGKLWRKKNCAVIFCCGTVLKGEITSPIYLCNLVEIVKFGWNCEIWSKLWNLVDFWLKLWNSNFYTCCFDCRRLQATQYFTDMEYWDVCFLMLNIIRTGTHGDRISLGTHFSNFVTWKLMFSIWRQNVNNITSKNEFWFLSCISMI